LREAVDAKKGRLLIMLLEIYRIRKLNGADLDAVMVGHTHQTANAQNSPHQNIALFDHQRLTTRNPEALYMKALHTQALYMEALRTEALHDAPHDALHGALHDALH
jgi:hypothetical protein